MTTASNRFRRLLLSGKEMLIAMASAFLLKTGFSSFIHRFKWIFEAIRLMSSTGICIKPSTIDHGNFEGSISASIRTRIDITDPVAVSNATSFNSPSRSSWRPTTSLPMMSFAKIATNVSSLYNRCEEHAPHQCVDGRDPVTSIPCRSLYPDCV